MDLDLGYNDSFSRLPPRPPEVGGVGGGRATYVPSRPAARTWAVPEHVAMYQSSQIFGRLYGLIKSVALASAVGAGVSPLLDFSQASWPGFRNDLGYEPKGLADVEWSQSGWDGLIVPEEEVYIPRAAWVPHPISEPAGSHVISKGEKPVVTPPIYEAPQPNPPETQKQVDAAHVAWNQRLAEHNARMAEYNSMNDKWVARELAEKEGELFRQVEAQHREEMARIVAEAPKLSIDISTRPEPDTPVNLRVRRRVEQDRYAFRRRQSDSKYAGAKMLQVIDLVMDKSIGPMSEVGDFVDALVWNVYALDGRGRPIQAMLKWNRNMNFVLRKVAMGQAKVDLWGFAVDFAIQQWSDAAYAFNSRKQDEAALQLGWKAPRGISTVYRNELRMMEGWQDDVSSSWVRSQSRAVS